MKVKIRSKQTENGYPRPSTTDKDEEYSYIRTDCQNMWYSTITDPMYRNNCICPKCGKVIKVIMPKNKEEAKNDI